MSKDTSRIFDGSPFVVSDCQVDFDATFDQSHDYLLGDSRFTSRFLEVEDRRVRRGPLLFRS
jgi:hypothetical protein